jgi:O-antigen/teichoic acid export membrane protein
VLGLILVCAIAAPALHAFLLPVTPPGLLSALDALIVGALVVSCLNIVTAAQFGVLEALGRYDLKLLAAISASILMVAVVLATYRASSAALVALVFIAGAACNAGIGAFMGWRLLRARATQAERIPAPELWRLLRIAFPVRAASMLTFGLEPVTRAALTRLAGVDAVALYEIAYRVVFQLRSAIVAGLQPLVPHLARLGATTAVGRHSETVLRAAACGVAVAIPALCLALISLPALTMAVLGRAEPEVLLFGALLAAAWLANIAAAPAYFANLAQGRVHRNWVSQAVMCLLNVTLAPLAGHIWGATGIVSATAFAVFGGSVATLLIRHDESRQLARRLDRADWFALAGGIAGVVLIALAWWHGLGGIDLVGFEAAVALVYTALVALPMARRLSTLLKGLDA